MARPEVNTASQGGLAKAGRSHVWQSWPTSPTKASSAGPLAVLGVTDDRDFCQCRGRQGLKRVVWVEEGESREVHHSGAVCTTVLAARGFGITLAAKVAIA
ncbi:hypothetical protein LMG3410_01473 [Achromobacter aegrifaciens]|uniref:Uncharacterized protein n=1 Tax=Achromobacter mucicolens TaxID=1389922 RepID=A0ABM8LKU8_9BURK|nr:hypothetical protein MC81_31025 [Achromobacter insolitus]CAB3845158.1 hypothetical protein LMG3410_01473 [Achromobacter aegrifaciens]CAB3914876.1 hypothetical protein LMG3415_05177 [Achromobacter mucicolens]